MGNSAYQSSMFWEWSYHASDLGHVVWPFLLSAAVALLAWRNRNAWTLAALVGVSLVLASHVTHMTRPKIEIVSKGGYALPADGVNPLIVFCSLHAFHIGMLITVVSLLGHTLRSIKHA
jgi:hypothetical protein